MSGLIPLMLNTAAAGPKAGSVSVASSPAGSSSSSPSTSWNPHKRMASLDSPNSISRPRVLRRLSLQAPASLPVLPYTPAEWTKAVAEVKRHYSNRRYRPCSARCSEILDNIKNQSAVEPAYLIYLHFYAAGSLEMLARPLSSSSSYRTRLLEQARTHYKNAATLIQTADETMSRASRPSSAATSTSSLHSPCPSISSHTSTELSSPAPSICSIEDAAEQLAQESRQPTKKRVTFNEKPIDVMSEPLIRPDSPTLGFEDFHTRSRSRSRSPDNHRYLPPLQELPEPVSARPIPEAAPQVVAKHPPSSLPPTPEPPIGDEDPSLLRALSIQRYCGLLASLRGQVASHLSAIESQLAPSAYCGPKLNRMSCGEANPALTDEMRALELKLRIERLRANGWKRQRFDPKRYEDLVENALAEMC